MSEDTIVAPAILLVERDLRNPSFGKLNVLKENLIKSFYLTFDVRLMCYVWPPTIGLVVNRGGINLIPIT